MTTPGPDHQRLTAHWRDEDAAIDIFTVRLPRWLFVRLFGRNPLIRTSDRLEAVVLVLAVAVSLLAAPIAAAAGTAVYDALRHVYAEQAQTRQTVTATVTEIGADHDSRRKTITVPARWSLAGREHTGAVKAQSTVKTGDPIEIWVNADGSQVAAPIPVTCAAVEAVMAALAIWTFLAAAAVGLFVGARILLDRIRHTQWQHDIDTLFGFGDGHISSQT